ncbi:hypothetical protein SNE40_005141 [Patella caerulea]|uniref:Myb-like domain-containing protein n=1 Tax=Patella caerulea TaxID=87958 RepID=A0AAN8PZ22_PATCE
MIETIKKTCIDSGMDTNGAVLQSTTTRRTDDIPVDVPLDDIATKELPSNNTNSTDRKVPKVWGEAETKLLISLREERQASFDSGKRSHKTLWSNIAKLMDENGYQVTLENCSNKWKSLKRTYTETVDYNSRTGNEPKTCSHYETFNKLYGNNPSVRPAFTMDSLPSTSTEDATDPDVSEEFDDCHQVRNTKQKGKVGGRKGRKSVVSPTVQWLTAYTEEQEKKRQKREESVERRHLEKMQRLDRFLDILDKKN